MQTLIKDIGSARDILEGKKNNPLMMFVQENMQELIVEIRKQAVGMDIVASRNLIQSIAIGKLEVDENSVDGEVIADDYWKFINYGVNGRLFNAAPNWKSLGVKSQGIDELIKELPVWMSFKNIQPKEGQTVESTATSIAMAIIRNGKVPRPFVTQTVEQTKVFNKMAKGISDIIASSMATKIKNDLENGNNNSK
jgi:hypothetical protein